MLIGITKLEKTHKKVLEAFMKKGKFFDKCKIARKYKDVFVNVLHAMQLPVPLLSQGMTNGVRAFVTNKNPTLFLAHEQ